MLEKPWHNRPGRLALSCACLATLVVLAMDVWWPMGAAGGLPYLLVVLLAATGGRRAPVLHAAGMVTLLTAGGALFGPFMRRSSDGWMLRLMSVSLFWIVAGISRHRESIGDALASMLGGGEGRRSKRLEEDDPDGEAVESEIETAVERVEPAPVDDVAETPVGVVEAARVDREGARELLTLRRSVAAGRARAAAAESALEGATERAIGAERALESARGQTISIERELLSEKERTVAVERALQCEKENLIAAERELQCETERKIAVEQALARAEERAVAAERGVERTKERIIAAEGALENVKEQTIAVERALECEKERAVAVERALESEKEKLIAAERASVNAEERAGAAERGLVELGERHTLALEDLRRELQDVESELAEAVAARKAAEEQGSQMEESVVQRLDEISGRVGRLEEELAELAAQWRTQQQELESLRGEISRQSDETRSGLTMTRDRMDTESARHDELRAKLEGFERSMSDQLEQRAEVLIRDVKQMQDSIQEAMSRKPSTFTQGVAGNVDGLDPTATHVPGHLPGALPTGDPFASPEHVGDVQVNELVAPGTVAAGPTVAIPAAPGNVAVETSPLAESEPVQTGAAIPTAAMPSAEEAFVAQLPEWVRTLRVAIAERDVDTVAETTRLLRESATKFDLERVYAAAEDVEIAIDHRDFNVLTAKVLHMCDLAELAGISLRTWSRRT